MFALLNDNLAVWCNGLKREIVKLNVLLYRNRRDKQGSSADGNEDKASAGNEEDDCEVCELSITSSTYNSIFFDTS